jgi:3-hydroxybutyryl-CoA dehydrogenase
MRKIGILGVGVMGMGVTQVFAQVDFPVIAVDRTNEILNKARKKISRSVLLENMQKGVQSTEDPLNHITFTTEIEDLTDVDVLIENITEDKCMKEDAYKKLDSVCRKDCMFMANVSCISITYLASLTSRPHQVIGAHFMNPVPMINSVELIKGFHTSDQTVSQALELLASIGKEGIVINDLPGFVSNRTSHLMMNEAAFIVQDQVASAEQVDKIFRDCYGHKMGPLETADLIGLDTVVNSLQVLYDSYQDPKFRCCPLLKKMVDAGLLGQKSGRGFYQY